MVRVPSVVSSLRRTPLNTLALAAGVAATSPALAQSRLSMQLDRPVIASGETVQVEVFGKHGSRNWVKIGEYTIDRQLLTE